MNGWPNKKHAQMFFKKMQYAFYEIHILNI